MLRALACDCDDEAAGDDARAGVDAPAAAEAGAVLANAAVSPTSRAVSVRAMRQTSDCDDAQATSGQ